MKRYGRKSGKRWSAKIRRSERQHMRLEMPAWVACERCRKARRFIIEDAVPCEFLPRTKLYAGRCGVCGCRRGWHITNWLILESLTWTDHEVGLNDPSAVLGPTVEVER